MIRNLDQNVFLEIWWFFFPKKGNMWLVFYFIFCNCVKFHTQKRVGFNMYLKIWKDASFFWLSYLVSQIWLNLLVDDCCFYHTKKWKKQPLPPTKKTLTNFHQLLIIGGLISNFFPWVSQHHGLAFPLLLD